MRVSTDMTCTDHLSKLDVTIAFETRLLMSDLTARVSPGGETDILAVTMVTERALDIKQKGTFRRRKTRTSTYVCKQEK